MNQHYAKAIDILMGNSVDYKNIAIELAKQNPELFCQLVAKASPSKDHAWHRDAISHLRACHLVSAIKLCREKTGFGLKEAKDVMDAVRSRDGQNWYNPSDLGSEQMAVYKEMIRSL